MAWYWYLGFETSTTRIKPRCYKPWQGSASPQTLKIAEKRPNFDENSPPFLKGVPWMVFWGPPKQKMEVKHLEFWKLDWVGVGWMVEDQQASPILRAGSFVFFWLLGVLCLTGRSGKKKTENQKKHNHEKLKDNPPPARKRSVMNHDFSFF